MQLIFYNFIIVNPVDVLVSCLLNFNFLGWNFSIGEIQRNAKIYVCEFKLKVKDIP